MAGIGLVCLNLMAFIYDGEYIKMAMGIDAIVVGAMLGIQISEKRGGPDTPEPPKVL